MGLPAVSTRNPKPHPHPQPNPYPFLQVHSEIASSMPDLQWPPLFGEISSMVSGVVNLDFATEHGDANCTLGNNYCFRVMMMMLAILGFQLAFPACIALVKYSPLRKMVAQERLEQLYPYPYPYP